MRRTTERNVKYCSVREGKNDDTDVRSVEASSGFGNPLEAIRRPRDSLCWGLVQERPELAALNQLKKHEQTVLVLKRLEKTDGERVHKFRHDCLLADNVLYLVRVDELLLLQHLQRHDPRRRAMLDHVHTAERSWNVQRREGGGGTSE